MSIESYLRAVPKAELHVHLEGTIRPRTLLTLASRNKVDLPASTPEELAEWFAFRDFDHFIQVYVTVTRCLRTAEDYELVTVEFARELAGQGARYAEVTFTPSTQDFLGVPHETYFSGITRGRERALREFGVEIAWIFDIVRGPPMIGKYEDYTVGVAIEGMSDGVVALGLAGKESDGAPERFAPWFDRARAAGLRSAPHAGETVGPESVWGAIRALGADRIGHGVRAIEDPALVEHLASHGIPIEVNPTSNVLLGVYPSMEEHPLARLREAGVIVTVNSDDPALFNTTINDEIALLAGAFDLGIETIDEILLAAVRHSFAAPEKKRRLEIEFKNEMTALKEIHIKRK